MRDYEKLPLMTPREAYDRAWETAPDGVPHFGVEYRVRNLDSWRAIETMLREDDVSKIVVASFGLRRFVATLDAIEMLRNRGWTVTQTTLRVYLHGATREVSAIEAAR